MRFIEDTLMRQMQLVVEGTFGISGIPRLSPSDQRSKERLTTRNIPASAGWYVPLKVSEARSHRPRSNWTIAYRYRSQPPGNHTFISSHTRTLDRINPEVSHSGNPDGSEPTFASRPITYINQRTDAASCGPEP